MRPIAQCWTIGSPILYDHIGALVVTHRYLLRYGVMYHVTLEEYIEEGFPLVYHRIR